jgi:hypothetical protein
VSYHVRKLRTLGLIKLVRKTPKRGVVEHYYAAKPRKTVTDREWGAMPGIVKDAMASSFVESALKTAADSADASGFTRDESHLSRHLMKLDERGWKEIAAVLAKALDDVKRIDDETKDRLKGEPHAETIGAASIMLFFETTDQLGMPSDESLDKAENSGRTRSRA